MKVFDELHASALGKKPQKGKFAKLSEFSDFVHIGEGAFGVTFKAKWEGSDVVLKVSKTKPGEQEFEEMGMLIKIPSHPNVVHILGLCMDFSYRDLFPDPTAAIIMPFYEHKDLMTYLGSELLDATELKNAALGMAKGVLHLHNNNIIHRDLRDENFLVDQDKRIIVSDFGLSRSVSGDDPVYHTSNAKLPWRWSAPESIIKLRFTEQSDVWMIGVSYWQLFHKAVPFSDFETPVQLGIAFANGLKLDIRDDCPEFLATIIEQCTRHSPGERMSVQNVIDALMVDACVNDSLVLNLLDVRDTNEEKKTNTARENQEKKPNKARDDKKPNKPTDNEEKKTNAPNNTKKCGDLRKGYTGVAPGTSEVASAKEYTSTAPGEQDMIVRCVLIGSSNVGKSCLYHRYTKGQYKSGLVATVGFDMGIERVLVGSKRVKLFTFDCAGQESFFSSCQSLKRGADVVLLMYDMTSQTSFQQLQRQLDEVRTVNVPIFLIGGKCDLEKSRRVEKQEVAAYAKKIGAKYVCETSAKSGFGIDLLFAKVAVVLLENEQQDADGIVNLSLINQKKNRSGCC